RRRSLRQIFVFFFFFSSRRRHTRFSRDWSSDVCSSDLLRSIRENEGRAISLGYSVANYKLAAFVMSATLAGLAGATKAIVFQFATLTDVTWQMSGEVILMTPLGGIGTMIGPIVGATLVVTVQHTLPTSGFPVTIATGLIFMACVLVFRRGIVGEILARLPDRNSK